MAKRARRLSRLGSSMTLEQMDHLVAEWVQSAEGKEQLQATQESARKAAEKVISDAMVDAEQLRQAVTL